MKKTNFTLLIILSVFSFHARAEKVWICEADCIEMNSDANRIRLLESDARAEGESRSQAWYALRNYCRNLADEPRFAKRAKVDTASYEEESNDTYETHDWYRWFYYDSTWRRGYWTYSSNQKVKIRFSPAKKSQCERTNREEELMPPSFGGEQPLG